VVASWLHAERRPNLFEQEIDRVDAQGCLQAT
jgi:hypothetical protein